MDWKECEKDKIVKEISLDKPLVNSLLSNSLKKLKTQELLKLDETTASSKISLTYDSLRELLEALSISKGYKIYNHECYCAFLKEILNESFLSEKFDSLRKIRNSINYYGKDISIEEAKSILTEIIVLIKQIKKQFFK